MENFRDQPVGIIGAGAAGLITAHTLLQDGFTNVQVITRDASVGGVWARSRVYPGLLINNVHGEFRFSCLPMDPPANSSSTGGRLSGDDMCAYMETFADTFLQDKIRFNTKVLNIRRALNTPGWLVTVSNKTSSKEEVLEYARIVLCTGGCSNPFIPPTLSREAAKEANFRGLVLHSSEFQSLREEVLSRVRPASSESPTSVVIVGGGKSAQDIATYLTSQGRKVSMVFETTDAFLAVTKPLPDFIRKSRFLGVMSPHIELRTRLERFLHTTWLGSKIVRFVWDSITESSFAALKVPKDSPLRRAHSLFWGIRTNDEGVGRPDGFFALANAGKIDLVAPARALKFSDDGRSVVLSSGTTIAADAVILATGYSSSWRGIFDEETANELGISRRPPEDNVEDKWNYTTLADPPPAHPDSQQWASSIYRGLVPARTIDRRDFAINGALFTTNNGYIYEVSAHWIAAYFRRDALRVPTPAGALAHAARTAAWMRARYPDMLLWTNESYSSGLSFWTWPQTADELLEDMGLRSGRSGGGWLAWPFKVMDLREIATLKEERDALRGSA